MRKYFSIDGYWKDTGEVFGGYIVTNFDDYDSGCSRTEDEIFFYGLNEDDLNEAVAMGESTAHDFVITNFEEV